jgi:hypothetical protein
MAAHLRIGTLLLVGLVACAPATTPGGPSPGVAHPTASATTIGAPAGSFSTGKFAVGKDIAPGTYRTNPVHVPCYWARLRDQNDSLDSVIANDLAGGPAVVTIAPSDGSFESAADCGTWTRDLTPITLSPTAPFGSGTFIVGTDIAPGRWRGGGADCSWERLQGFSGERTDVVASGNPKGVAVVNVRRTDAGFKSSSCGMWRKIDEPKTP